MIATDVAREQNGRSTSDLIAHAREVAPGLRERATEGEALRRLPDANVADIQRAGVGQALQSRAYGGLETDLHTFIDAVAALAEGCGSTAWCAGVMNAHHWLAAAFPEQAQEDVYAARPDALISAVITPRGRAVRVPGGFTLSGVWPFCSGCHHADWLMLGAQVAGDDGSIADEGEFLIPKGAAEMRDDWHVGGLRSTGSNTVATRDLFVPEHRYLSMRTLIGAQNDAPARHDGTLYRSAAVPVLALALAPPALGIAESALADFKKRLPGRAVAYTDQVQSEMPVTHMQFAQAEMKVRSARLLLHATASDIESFAAASMPMPLELRARSRMDAAYAVRLCLEAVEILYLASGGTGIANSSHVQRAQRDLHAINMHGLMCLETNLEMYGRIALGLAPNTPLV